jgi:hypothetical protein
MNCRPKVCDKRETAISPLDLDIMRESIGHWVLRILTFALRIRIKSLAPHVGIFSSAQKILNLIP